MAAICSTRSWWAAKSLSKASCFFFKAFNSGKRHERKSCVHTPQIFYHFLSSPHKGIHQKKNVDADKFLTWDDSSSSLPWVQLSWMSDLCLNFLAKCSKRSNLLDKKLALTFYKRIARENSKAVSSTFLNEWKIEATSRAKMVIKTKYVALGGAERHVSTRPLHRPHNSWPYLIISESSHSSKDFSHPSKPFQALAISCTQREN